MKHALLTTVPVVALSHYGHDTIQGQLKMGDELILRSEPTNKFDPWAVEVFYQGTKIGYIPRANSQGMTYLLHGAGAALSCRNEGYDGNALKLGLYLLPPMAG